MDTSISFSQVVPLQCPECGVPITAEVWWIIDESERPDLIERCRRGDIHDLACPNGHVGMAKAPLLLRLTSRERILFSPPESTTREQDDAMKLALAQRLQSALSEISLEQLLTQIEQTSRLFLPLVLKGKPDDQIGALKALLRELYQVVPSTETPRRIGIIHQALKQISREDSPPLWALLQAELGFTYLDSTTGDRAENLEQAIVAFHSALSVWSRTTYPDAWAEAQNNLGEAYRNRVLGDRSLNIESAINAYLNALIVRTRDVN
ncbi:MAG TPA: CpXC domain-containing protein, partial [Anaerolineales bacterium]|nr:CpXC domain-containing protein [Anaerolineales bacterium]